MASAWSAAALDAVIADVVAGRYSDLQLAAFVTACAGNGLDLRETVALTRSMVDAGERIDVGRSRRDGQALRRRPAGQPHDA